MKFSHDYDAQSLADRFHGKPTGIEAPVCRYLDAGRTSKLTEQMLAAGIPL
jgi:hypothetical protein